MFELRKRGTVEYFTPAAWDVFPYVTAAFCTRRGGVSTGPYASLNMSGREGEAEVNVNSNWEVVAAAFGLARRHFFRIHQVHGDGILVIDDEAFRTFTSRPPAYDAVIAARPGLALCILTADCVPLLMFDGKKGVIAAVHAGWRGTALGIARRAATLFKERFQSRPADIQVAIGPAIGPCCYEVDDVVHAAMAGHPEQDAAFAPRRTAGKWRFDLRLANRRQLEETGIPVENIQETDLCTSCRREIFFSHRGEAGKTGRLLNFVVWNEGHPG